MHKSLKFIFCLVVILWILQPQSLFAQPYVECQDACSGSLWSAPPVTYSSTVCSGSVTFVTKFCQGVYILKILAFSGTNPTDDMIKVQGCLMYELLKNNPMLFPPSTPQEGTIDWKIIKSACWYYTDVDRHNQFPCPYQTCCYTKVKVRKEVNCGLIINIVDENGDLSDCPPFGVGNNGCFDTCIPTKLPNPLKVQ